MKLTLKIADETEIKDIQIFFKKHLKEDSNGIINEEFLCPFGVKAGIEREQMIVLKNENEILGTLRFYPRKRDNIVSVYQFALDERIRGKGLIKKMLQKTGYNSFESICSLNSEFNNYYEKTGWTVLKVSEDFKYWGLFLE